jgi:signal transduction histidine kinase
MASNLAFNTRRHQRDRWLLVGLILLILGPSMVYAGLAVGAAREVARRQALERNLAAAQLGAEAINTQCNSSVAVLRSLAERPSLLKLLQQACQPNGRLRAFTPRQTRSIRQHLDDVVALVPEINRIALYSSRGVLISRYPGAAAFPPSALGRKWFERCRREHQPYIGQMRSLPDHPEIQAVNLAVPVGPGARPIGYITAPLRLEIIRRWLQPLRLGAGSFLYVTDTTSRVMVSSQPPVRQNISLAGYPPVRLALEGENGSAQLRSPLLRRQALVGYAPVRLPGWAVVASSPMEEAVAASNHLLRPFLLLVVPLLALILAAGWAIERMYHQQVSLLGQNEQLLQSLSAQYERLRAADRVKSDFLANISHDLRTPLSNIKASISGLLEPEIHWDTVSRHGLLILVNEEIDRLVGQIRNLLDMARLEGKALPPRKEQCDLTEIVGDALDRVMALTRGWALEADFPSEPLLVEADSSQIETVVVNLLENATKYAPPGTRLFLRGEIRSPPAAEGSTPPEAVVFTLRDEGPGVSPGDDERIFEKFYRSNTLPHVRGTGLGLAICKAILEAHGGAIGVRSAGEGGAEFWFSLPGAGELPERAADGGEER